MRFSLKYFLFFLIIVSCRSWNELSVLNVTPFNDYITYEGRIGEHITKKAKEVYWSGTSIKINFKGTSIKATLEDENGFNYFNIILDGKAVEVLELKKGKGTYILAEGLENIKHSIELTKRNEWTYGKSLFYGFEVRGDILEPDSEKKLFIEYYGDSITVGHGNEDTLSSSDRNDGDVANNYNTYAAMTARNINAEYSCIARSGIGVTVSWFNMIMPEMYYRLDPSDASSKWDFSKKQPDIVVVNLFQNDSWIVKLPKHEEFIRRFGDQAPTENDFINAYGGFVSKLRAHYPKSSIICVLGNMDIIKKGSPWPNYVSKVVESLGDANMYTCFFPYKNTKNHPQVSEHLVMSDKLTEFIKTKILN